MKLPELESAVQRQPKDARTRYQLGLTYARLNRFRDASQQLLAANELDPSRPEILHDLGVAYLLQDRYYEALVALQAALVAKPQYASAYANLGRLHLATKMPFTASKELAESVRLDPNQAEAWCDLGSANQQTHSFKGAEDAYLQAIRLAPNEMRAYVGLGSTYTSMGRRPEAEKMLSRALELSPNDSTTLVTLGGLRLEKADSPAELTEVRHLYERAAKAEPNDEEAWFGLGKVDLELKRPALAVNNLERALVLSPIHMGVLHQLERAYRASGKTAAADRAAKLFRTRAFQDREESRREEYISHAPKDWDAKARLAELYLKSGKRAMAMLVYRQLRDGKADHPKLPALTLMLNPPTLPPIPPSLSGTGAPGQP